MRTFVGVQVVKNRRKVGKGKNGQLFLGNSGRRTAASAVDAAADIGIPEGIVQLVGHVS